MALTQLSWDIINKSLFVEGAKYWRTGYYNRKTGEENYICSEAKKTKCPCTALVRYFKVPNADGEQEHVSDDEHGDSGDEDMATDMFEEDPRLYPDKYDIKLLIILSFHLPELGTAHPLPLNLGLYELCTFC